ncbi:prepilin-type N-terminal cleavage/methylation domain-containing protein [bacterium]|nr:prepilin-type N-terminal cleavage/methylation domain-containing protein [bacterium]
MIRRQPTPLRGFTLVEVLVALAIMAAGVLVIATVFPKTLEASDAAQTLTIAAGLAQMKAEEIRRDNDQDGQMIDQIKVRTTPTDPIAFPRQPNLTYSFSGRSLIYTDPTDPRGAPGVPRVIIRYAAEFRKSQDVIYELRFDQTNH